MNWISVLQSVGFQSTGTNAFHREVRRPSELPYTNRGREGKMKIRVLSASAHSWRIRPARSDRRRGVMPRKSSRTRSLGAISSCGGFFAAFLALTQVALAGSLSGSGQYTGAGHNLTALGNIDWAAWGDSGSGSITPTNRKSQGGSLIGVSVVGGVVTFDNSTNTNGGLYWTDGTPTASQLATNGIETSNGSGGGYSLTFPASATPHTVYLFLGGRNNFPILTASLSDGSAPNYINNSLGASSAPFNVMFVLTYAAASNGQTLTVTYTTSNNASDVTLDGAAYGTVAPASGGIISGAVTTQTTQTNSLTSLGTSDWAEWGYTSGSTAAPANVKSGGGNTISAQVIDSTVSQFSGAAVSVSWTNGTPTASGTEATGISTSSGTAGEGFLMTFPADTNLRTLYIICGGYGNVGQLGVALSDGSAPEYLDASQSNSGGPFYALYTVTYKAASAGQSLIVSWVQLYTANNVTLSGAAYGVDAPCTGPCLEVTATTVNTPVNLTAEGTADWIHWGDAALNRKAGVTPQISNDTAVGGGQVLTYSNDPRPVSWTDGTPTASSTGNENGVYIAGVGQGFSYTVPANTTIQTLLVHVGGWNSGGTLTASLSDGSVANFVSATGMANGQYDRNYTIMYAAQSAGQVLTVSWIQSSGSGNVTLNAAALAGTPPPIAGSIAPSGGTPQSATVNTVFATPLQAVVKDTNDNLLSGVTVTFAAPTSGAGANFATGFTATAMTNSSGVATAPTLTANAQAGSYTVIASVAGVTATASFNLTNTAVPTPTPGNIAANAGTPQSTTVGTQFGTALQTLVKDTNGNPYSGATVTFTAPGSGASAAFSGSTTATAVTNASGIASAPPLTANSQTGSYSVTATVSGVSLPASFALTNTATSGASGASLVQQAAGSNLGNNTNTLTVTLPHLPSNSNVLVLIFDQIGASQAISSITGANWTRVGQSTSQGDLEIWTGTNPSSSTIAITGTNYFGVFQPGYAIVAEFSGITATLDGAAVPTAGGSWPATTGTLITTNASDLLMTAALSYNGGGAEAAVSSGWTLLAAPPGTFSLAAAFQSATTTGTYAATLAGFGSPQVATIILALKTPGSAGSILTTAGTPQSAPINSVFGTAPQATVNNASNNPVSGVTVTFTAPSTGASATFSGSATATAVTNASGIATAPAMTANGQAGAWSLLASAPGIFAPASFSLSNQAGPPASIAPTAGSPQNATINTVFATALQATVKDAGNNPISGVTVTFTAPSSGASATFSGAVTATALTNPNGIATAPALTANLQSGSYVVVAATPGVGGSASFGLTNLAGTPFSISATAGAPQSATVSTVYATALQATVKDVNNNALGGVTVTFTAPSTGASATFSGSYTATAITNASGIATAPALTANGQAGGWTLLASVPGVSTSAGFSLTNQAGPPASIAATAGTPQSATVSTMFATALQATVKDSSNNPVSGITVTFTAPPTGASATFNGVASATALTNASGVAIAPALTANAQSGSYGVSAAVAGVGASASFTLTNSAVVSGGTPALAGSGTSSAGTANLTGEGSSDWVHWGDSSLTRKAGVTPQLSNYSVVGSGPVMVYSNDPRALSWTDGTPTADGNNNNGIYISSVQNGFSVTAPADTGTRVLTLYVGGWLSGATLTARLSDNSAANYVDVTTPAAGQYDRNYTLTYSAASAGQTLTVSWVMTSGAGNVTMNGAALSGGSPSTGNPTINATAGTPQSAAIGTVLAAALQATVRDVNNNPLSGVTVTFTAPASGASATFSGSTTAMVLTNASGVATAPALTTNAQLGSYTVTATAIGASASAAFSITNLPGPPASITATSGTPQSAIVNTTFPSALQVTVTDAKSNPLSGVSVTFTAPATGASAFFGGGNVATAITNASGIATIVAPTAGAIAGGYTIAATTAGGVGPANFSLTNTAVVSGGSSPALVQQSSGSNVGNNQYTLSVTLGTQPASGNVLILIFGQVSASQTITSVSGATWSRVAQNFTGNIGDSEVWVGTNPTSSTITVTGTNAFGGCQPGYAIVSEFSGISPTLDGIELNTAGGSWPLTTGSLTTLNAVDLLLTSALSYNGGGVYATVPTPWTLFTAPGGTYSLAAGYQFAAATGTYASTWNGYGSPQVATIILALKAASSAGGIIATAGTPQSATIKTGFGTALQATVKNAANNPVSGVTVTFTAPSTGASATFSGSATATAATNASGIATAPALTANGQAGAWTLVASAPGISTSASFSLNNLAGSPASIAATAGNPQSATINTVFVTPLQAMVTDGNNNAISGANVTFSAPASGASATFSGSSTATVATNASGIAIAPALTANGQSGAYTVTAATAGVGASANFSLTNSTAPPVPITRVQQAQIDSLINIQSESVSFASPNTAGNWIGVAIFGGQSDTHLFTVTDSNGNLYQRALTVGNMHDNITLGMYYAENIKGGANQITVVPDTSGYIRIVIVEYSGLATSNSLDVTGAAMGSSVSPNSGTVNTTANGDLLWGASASADAEPFAGPGYTLDALVPASPGTALTTEDQIQTAAGPASASLTFGSSKDWTMGLVAVRKAP